MGQLSTPSTIQTPFNYPLFEAQIFQDFQLFIIIRRPLNYPNTPQLSTFSRSDSGQLRGGLVQLLMILSFKFQIVQKQKNRKWTRKNFFFIFLGFQGQFCPRNPMVVSDFSNRAQKGPKWAQKGPYRWSSVQGLKFNQKIIFLVHRIAYRKMKRPFFYFIHIFSTGFIRASYGFSLTSLKNTIFSKEND